MPIRTITIPVAEVVTGGTKAEFYRTLRESLDIARGLANGAVSACLQLDDLTKPKAPKLYTYPLLDKPAGYSGIAANIARDVEKRYISERWELRVGRRSARSYRQHPYPLLGASKKVFRVEDTGETLQASFRMGGVRWVLRLAGGSNNRHAIQGLRQVVLAGGIRDSKIWLGKKNKAILGIACEVPVRAAEDLAGTLAVTTSRDSLLVLTQPGTVMPFVINADHVRAWKAEANRRQQRLRQDRKSGSNRRRLRRVQQQVRVKMSQRLKSAAHELSAQVVTHAKRKRVATVVLDFTVKSYYKQFPWFDLKAKIQYKCEAAGIEVVDRTMTVKEPDAEKPHVYFKYCPGTHRIKIGRTIGAAARKDKGRHGGETDAPQDLVVLAVDNQPKTKLVAREKHFHAYFQEHRTDNKNNREWFHAEPVLAWLREVDWIGNAGNLSQIKQVLAGSSDAA